MNTAIKVALGNDHAGYELRLVVLDWLRQKGFEVVDFGTDSEEPVDYPDYVHPLALSVERGESDLGVLICGSGQGVSITANKHQGIRAALCWIPEIASLARSHNSANILCLPGRYIGPETACAILEQFFSVDFEGGRHQRRVEKVPLK